MNPLDYSRSTITFRIAGVNNARIQVESSCRLTLADGTEVETWLVASCKSEHTYAERDLFSFPNYDFSILYSRERYRIFRIHAEHRPEGDESGLLADRFADVTFQLVEANARRCESVEEILDAGFAGWPLIARNELTDEETGSTAVLEYPVKTMNLNREKGLYQTDTGPLAVPQGMGWTGDLDGFRIGYAAFNRPDEVEFVLRRPTLLAGGDVVVEHYREKLVLPAVNSLWTVPDGR